jgi:hypothetical protein
MNSTLAYTLYKRRLLILVHTKNAPDDAEWREYAQSANKWKKEIQGLLVITEGGGPNTMQRAELDAALEIESHSAKTAVVTVSRIARGIVTAISWFSPGIKAFSTNQLGHALEYLGVSATEIDSVNAEIRRLKKDLGLPIT